MLHSSFSARIILHLREAVDDRPKSAHEQLTPLTFASQDFSRSLITFHTCTYEEGDNSMQA